MAIAVIPARGGSKRIPRKNIRAFCGRPMITWSIDAARRSGCFSNVVVSTDDEEIAEVARAAGADVPFLRPAHLSDDHTGTLEVVQHAVGTLSAQGLTAPFYCCLYATAPFVAPRDLVRGLEALRESDADYAMSVTSFAFPIQRALRLRDDGRIEMIWPEQRTSRSQDLEHAYHDAGQFYWGRATAWAAGRQIIGPGTLPVLLPRHRVQDIDTPEDWERAALMFRTVAREQT